MIWPTELWNGSVIVVYLNNELRTVVEAYFCDVDPIDENCAFDRLNDAKQGQ